MTDDKKLSIFTFVGEVNDADLIMHIAAKNLTEARAKIPILLDMEDKPGSDNVDELDVKNDLQLMMVIDGDAPEGMNANVTTGK